MWRNVRKQSLKERSKMWDTGTNGLNQNVRRKKSYKHNNFLHVVNKLYLVRYNFKNKRETYHTSCYFTRYKTQQLFTWNILSFSITWLLSPRPLDVGSIVWALSKAWKRPIARWKKLSNSIYNTCTVNVRYIQEILSRLWFHNFRKLS